MRFFILLYRLSQWLRRRFTVAGLYVLGAASVAAATGLDTTQSLSYQMFALLAALLMLALLGSMRFSSPITVRRNLPKFATVNEPCEYGLVLHGAKHPAGLVLRDNLATEFPTHAEYRLPQTGRDAKRNRFDRNRGYPRWLWLLHCKRGAKIEELRLPKLSAKQPVKLKNSFTPLRRGLLHFSGISIGRTDPLGLAQTFMELPCRDTLPVLPRRYPIPGILLPGTRKYQRGGIALSSKVGDAEEFSTLRDYRPGDAMRRIHWKSWAKTGQPVVKEYHDEYFVRHALVLDTFAAPQHAERFEEAVSIAASLLCSVQEQDSLLDLMFVVDRAYRLTSGRNVAQSEHLLQVLAQVSPCQDKPFGRLASFVAGHLQQMSGCICVLLAWDEDRQALVANLRSMAIPLRVLVIADRGAAPLSAAADVHRLECGKIIEGLRAL